MKDKIAIQSQDSQLKLLESFYKKSGSEFGEGIPWVKKKKMQNAEKKKRREVSED